ncbi:MAG: guanylate kinase [Lachnospiraceae bacterium]|jgi:guanylate kinase|nr:guanylate kinase [Lachnospiraceae bacterium]MBQ4275596.1 guanylate kinase [Lachnospiraceae bacterium]MCR4696834.1 guanylate kinase [Lachnospiraceae bacterium]
MNNNGILVVISGFSGAGKGTLVRKLMEKYDNYALSISMTTRDAREGEEDGVHYFFVDHKKFEQTIANDGLLEYASYCGNYYGTPREYVEKQIAAGKDVILEIEVQGALQIKKKFPNTLLLFVTPPSAKELAQRLRDRHTETDEQIAGRLSRATEEVEWISKYDFLVINDDIERSVDRLNDIIVAAHNVPIRQQEMINEIKKDLEVMTKGEL